MLFLQQGREGAAPSQPRATMRIITWCTAAAAIPLLPPGLPICFCHHAPGVPAVAPGGPDSGPGSLQFSAGILHLNSSLSGNAKQS